ncbi:MAG: hypothetical protein JXA30_09070 [Deltaproteobacteria bacterium]|nr:hypothetical protein [Deltaproteobacteria bacterium]
MTSTEYCQCRWKIQATYISERKLGVFPLLSEISYAKLQNVDTYSRAAWTVDTH